MKDQTSEPGQGVDAAAWTGLSRGFPTPPGDRNSRINESVFYVDEDTFRSSLPQVTHWSIAWSDLMMTMFVVFLSLFVYQAAHRQFLVSDEIEVIGGDTAPAVEPGAGSQAAIPFVPITSGAPLITAGTVKRIEPIRIDAIEEDAVFFDEAVRGGRHHLDLRIAAISSRLPKTSSSDGLPRQLITPLSTTSIRSEPGSQTIFAAHENSRNLRADKAMIERSISSAMASVDLPADQTMRITLHSDRLFASNSDSLSPAAEATLRNIGAIIWDIPHSITVIGYTDDSAIQSKGYETPWELSVAQAACVARFLIEKTGMNPQQFAVTGYGSQRPMVPNYDDVHRSINRRIELVISKRLQTPINVSAVHSPKEKTTTDEL